MAAKIAQNIEDLKAKFEATKSHQESTSDEEMQQRQIDREQIMNAMQGIMKLYNVFFFQLFKVKCGYDK